MWAGVRCVMRAFCRGRWIWLAAGVLLLLLVAEPARGQESAVQCAPRERALSWLAEKYAERSVSVGVAASGMVVEILVSPDGSTWSILLVSPAGIACMVASGTNWEKIDDGRGG